MTNDGTSAKSRVACAALAFLLLGAIHASGQDGPCDADPSSGAISGQLLTTTGEPLPWQGVVALRELGDWIAYTTTSASGTYRLCGLPVGSYVVDFYPSQDGLNLARHSAVHVSAESVTSVSAELTLAPLCNCVTVLPTRSARLQRALFPWRWRARRQPTTTGVVMSEAGVPLPHAVVEVAVGDSYSERGYTDAHGRFVVRTGEPLPFRLVASRSGFESVSRSISPSDDGQVVLRLPLARDSGRPVKELLELGCKCGRLAFLMGAWSRP